MQYFKQSNYLLCKKNLEIVNIIINLYSDN
jgi:hypothetical protein